VQIAIRLQECLRDEDTIARLGGDEFTVLLQDLRSMDTVLDVTNRIVLALAQPIQLDHGETVAMASIGIAYSEKGLEPAESLLRDADTAMYAAKARGKSGYAIFDPAMNAEVVERMQLEVGMRQALEGNQFSLEYQPIVDLSSGDITGIEALLRWEHPERGRITPDKFIPVAEDSGLIIPIGAWVLRESCLRFRELREQFTLDDNFHLSVNVSGRQLQRPNIVDQIRTILEETHMDPASLKLEVTESVLVRDEVAAVEKLHQLKALGIKIAIDDFGTGYSSLSTLNSYPVDVVKIDRTFIGRMGQDEEVDAIVGAIVLLSRVMHLEVTAEGIETRQQVQYLQAFGCTSAQGFYFCRPMPFDKLCKKFSEGMNLSVKLEAEATGILNPMLAA
ncbi:MAG: bifunctional diguanylate cyclase/phosphodiesterase, partial [Chlorobia bacterium]|nr:bifunctional diguanylate cyclase/phosphodiesterase [Fimbriimonadaceae bacterium]